MSGPSSPPWGPPLDLASASVAIVGRPGAEALRLARLLLRLGTQRFVFVGADSETGTAVAEEIRRMASGIWSLHVVADPSDPVDLARGLAEASASIGDPQLLVAEGAAGCDLDALRAEAARLACEEPTSLVLLMPGEALTDADHGLEIVRAPSASDALALLIPRPM